MRDNRYSIILVYPIAFKRKTDYSILVDGLISMNYNIQQEYAIDESKEEEAEKIINEAVYSVKRYMPDGGFIVNFLETDVSIWLYISLYNLMKNYHENLSSSSEYTDEYIIISTKLQTFFKIDPKYRDGHLCRTLGYPQKDTFLKEFINSIYGENMKVRERLSIAISSIDMLLTALKLINTQENFVTGIKSLNISTSYGVTTVGNDNYISFPLELVVSELGEIETQDILYREWESDTYRKQFNQNLDKYLECNKDEDSKVKIINLLIIVDLTGYNYYRGADQYVSFVTSIDYLNTLKEETKIYYNPIVKDGNYEIDELKEMILNMTQTYKTSIILGIYGYLFL